MAAGQGSSQHQPGASTGLWPQKSLPQSPMAAVADYTSTRALTVLEWGSLGQGHRAGSRGGPRGESVASCPGSSCPSTPPCLGPRCALCLFQLGDFSSLRTHTGCCDSCHWPWGHHNMESPSLPCLLHQTRAPQGQVHGAGALISALRHRAWHPADPRDFNQVPTKGSPGLHPHPHPGALSPALAKSPCLLRPWPHQPLK